MSLNTNPVVVNDTVDMDQDSAILVLPFDNDSSGGGGDFFLLSMSPLLHGTLVAAGELPSDGFIYTPNAGFVGVELITYTVSNGNWGGTSLTAGITITVHSVNRMPIAVDDFVTVDEGSSVLIQPLDNDFDPDGHTFTLVAGGFPANGTIMPAGDSPEDGFIYTPNAGFTGEDSFQYTISDGELESTATITITVLAVNQSPIAVDDDVTVNANSSIIIFPLDNDTDPEGAVLSIVGLTQPQHGTVSPVNDSSGNMSMISFQYTPTPDFNGADAFTYTISDGALTATATISVTVVAVNTNNPPIAVDDSVTVEENGSVLVQPFDNDSDPDGDMFTLVDATFPQNGTIMPAGQVPRDGFIYTPNPGFVGVDSFQYTISDGEFESIATITITVTAVVVPPPGEANADFIHTHHDKIPNFGKAHTAHNVVSGHWSDPAIWSGGTTPSPADIVRISAGTIVTYDVLAAFDTIGVEGELAFATDQDTILKVANLLVYRGGVLTVGTMAKPVEAFRRAEIEIADKPLDLSKDPEQFGTGLLVFGKIRVHGAAMDTFVRIIVEPKAGDTFLTLALVPTQWRVGDQIVLPGTVRSSYKSWKPAERLEIASISGNVIGLTTPLTDDHLGARDGQGNLETFMLPHVANLTRNVAVHSENPAGTRGHVMFLNIADVDVRYANFHDLGRTKTFIDGSTKIAGDDNTTFDEAGNVTHIGTNQLARYSVHFHHVSGPPNPSNTGYQYELIGNSIHDGLRHGIAIHGSHYGLVQQNVVFKTDGTGIFGEDASESENVFDRNMTIDIDGDGKTNFHSGGSGMWFRGPNNYFTGNVSAGASAGYAFVAASRDNGAKIPTARGQMMPNYVSVSMGAKKIAGFVGNESYGDALSINLYHFGMYPNRGLAEETLIRDHTAWNVNTGYHPGYTNNVGIDGMRLRGDGTLGVGLQLKQIWYDRFVNFRNLDIQGFVQGIRAPEGVEHTPSFAGDRLQVTTIIDSHFSNITDIYIPTETIPGKVSNTFKGDGLRTGWPRTTIIRNATFTPMAGKPHTAIDRAYTHPVADTRAILDLTRHDAVFVDYYNGEPADNFQVYMTQQHGGFVVPAHYAPADFYNKDAHNKVIGAPVPGRTNQETWDTYGVAVGGAVAPLGAVVRAGINGLVAQYTGETQEPIPRVVFRKIGTAMTTITNPNYAIGYYPIQDMGQVGHAAFSLEFLADGTNRNFVGEAFEPLVPEVPGTGPGPRLGRGKLLVPGGLQTGAYKITGWLVDNAGAAIPGSNSSAVFSVAIPAG